MCFCKPQEDIWVITLCSADVGCGHIVFVASVSRRFPEVLSLRRTSIRVPTRPPTSVRKRPVSSHVAARRVLGERGGS